MAASEEEWIRHRAYELWEQEGYPSGKDAEHWERAKLEHALLKPVASDKGKSKGKISAVEAPLAAPSVKTQKSAVEKTGSKAEKTSSSKGSAAKSAPGAKSGGKAASAAAASARSEQTKKRPKKLAAE